jgi:hypothetical protein
MLKTRMYLFGLVALLTACGGGKATVEMIVDAVDMGNLDQAGKDGVTDLVADLATDLASEVQLDAVEMAPEEVLPECAPGDGCFLDPCSENDQCLSGYCLEHMGEGVCTQVCQEECPPGWSCKAVGADGPDMAWVCVSKVSNLCKPCAGAGDCKSPGGADDVCVAYGSEGSFCGGKCLEDKDCPWGFLCGEAVTVDGVSTQQCIAETGGCPCTAKSVELALATPCEVANDFGVCPGHRVCTADGLSDCDAAVPAAESCNGLDDDCDGDVDEPALVEGKQVHLCDDGNPCTEDLCDGEEGCVNEPLDGTECQDGDPCTVADHCVAGECTGTPALCDDKNPCTDDTCGVDGGCLFVNNNAACDDGDPCTVADQCKAGECSGVAVSCDCQEDADCAALEDGNLCNGSLFCDKEELPYQCALVPDSVVECPEPEGVDAPCLAAACDPESGACSLVPAHEGMACNDGDKCTLGDTCADGVCTPGVPANCNDGNPCTDDSCGPAQGCIHVDNDAPCSDGDACTLGDQCVDGECVPGAPKSCDDGNPCTDDSCSPAEGCLFVNNDVACDDGNACTLEDHCLSGKCVATGSLKCNDVNPCTDDGCNPASGCFTVDNELACSDGNACTTGDQCAGGECVPGAPVNCDDGNVCTDDSCDAATGCAHANTGPIECDDLNECTVDDHCVNGVCVGTGSLECDDGNICTKDFCLPDGGCAHQDVAGPCSDGDACTLNDFCQDGACVSGPPVSCDDKNVCTTDTCDPATGCTHGNSNEECSDGNACTEGDQCSEGSCVPGEAVDCDDDNVCTVDWCSPLDGCHHLAVAGACDDGNACTDNDQCAQGECVPGPATSCDDGNACTDDDCDPADGCEHVPNEAPCDDGDACTVGDLCADGACLPGGESLACDDDNICTNDGCVPAVGCVHLPNDESCDDGSVCTLGDVCKAGICTAGSTSLNCNDGEICTADSCDAELGCIHEVVVPCCGNGFVEPPEQCDDGNHLNDDDCTAVCQHATCDDLLANGSESDVDCGGECEPCADGLLCLDDADCESGVCGDGTCQEPTCDDGVQNGDETDVDCGGEVCAPCGDGLACLEHGDCVSGYCEDGVCQEPACDDQVHNGDETDLDCGGPECDPCADGLMCGEAGDCQSGVCADGICQEPTCDDEVLNGGETDVDCGGSCGECAIGQGCELDVDCAAGIFCVEALCTPFGSGKDGPLAVSSGTTTINSARVRVQAVGGSATLTAVDAVNGGFGAGDLLLVHQTTGGNAGLWELARVSGVDGSTVTLTDTLTNSYTTSGNTVAQAVRVQQVTTLAVSGGTLIAPQWNGSTGGILAVVASESMTLSGGTLNMDGRGFRGQSHGCMYRCSDGHSGESPSGPYGTNSAPGRNGMGGGGGTRGQDCAGGGGGGYGTAGGGGPNGGGGTCAASPHLGGQGGLAGGQADTSGLILFGGAGGEGGGDEDGAYPGNGGAGGGIIILLAPTVQVTSGTVRSHGATGGSGNQTACGGWGCGMSGGGGGAGGGIYLHGLNVELGDSKVSATGGGGGDCTCGGYTGGSGGVGRIAVRQETVSGTTSPTYHELPFTP